MVFNKTLLSILILFFFVLIFCPLLIQAQCQPACPSGQFCIPNPLRACSFQELLYNIVDFLFNLAIPLAALMIIVAGYYFVSAAGKPEQITTAKNIVLWTLIGFLVILCAKGIIWFLMNVVFPPAP